MPTIKALEKEWKMFKVNNKNTRTTSKNCFSFDNVRPCEVTLIKPFHDLVFSFTPWTHQKHIWFSYVSRKYRKTSDIRLVKQWGNHWPCVLLLHKINTEPLISLLWKYRFLFCQYQPKILDLGTTLSLWIFKW